MPKTKTVKTKKPVKRTTGATKNKLKTLKQTDGRNHQTEREKTLLSIDEFFGFKKSKFPTLDETEYRQSLADMNKLDLQRESIRLGLIPIEDKMLLKERIMREFKKHIMALKTQKIEPAVCNIDPNNKELREILSQGA